MGIPCGWDHLRTSYLLELIDFGEYLELSDNAKDFVRILLSCGNINFREGSIARNSFVATFPDGTTTYANWIALLEKLEPPEII